MFKPRLTSELILNICECIPRHFCTPELAVSALGTTDCYFGATWRLESCEKNEFYLKFNLYGWGFEYFHACWSAGNNKGNGLCMRKGYCSPAWAMLDLKKIRLYCTQSKWISVHRADKYYFKKALKIRHSFFKLGNLCFVLHFCIWGFFLVMWARSFLGSMLCNLNKFKKIKRRVVSGQEHFWRFLELFSGEGYVREGKPGARCGVTSCSWCVTFLSACSISQSGLWPTRQIGNN